jgi:hypothetical protein
LAKTALLIFLALAFTLGEETTTAIAFFYSSSEKIVRVASEKNTSYLL